MGGGIPKIMTAHEAYQKNEQMLRENNIQPGDYSNPNSWYCGGYYCGLIDSPHRPDDEHGQEMIDAWYLGFEDGKGDRNGWSS